MFILTMDQLTMCNVKSLALVSLDENTLTYRATLQFPTAQSFSIFQLIILVVLFSHQPG